MKSLTLMLAVSLVGCATQHRAPTRDISGVYIDCTNRAAFEAYFNRQLSLTDMQRINDDPVERQYYAVIKDRLWSLRSVCR
jgi:hypothetical protein